MQLAIPLSKANGPLFRQVYLGLRQAIFAGSFAPHGRLPSTRDLADQLRVSRTVVLLAYDQLLAEGFVEGRSGSGTYVAQGLSSKRSAISRQSTKPRQRKLHHGRIFRLADHRFIAMTLPPAAAKVILRPSPSKSGAASFCGVHGRPR